MQNSISNTKLRVLIVDDDSVDREMVRRYLLKSHQDFEIDEATNVDDGLALYDKNKHDIILLDYRMPRRDGIEMIIELRTHLRNYGSAIVMMSSADDEKLTSDCLEAGAQDFIPKSEISSRRLHTALIHAKARFKLEQELRKSYLKSKDLAEKDTLTGLANRFVFEENLAMAIANNPRSDFKLGLLLFDIDNFKTINDIHGHDIGDAVLKEVARCVSNCLRNEELFSRVGGDEFAIVISNLKDAYHLNSIANRIVSSLNEPIIINHIVFNIDISVGIALHPDNSPDGKELIKCSDIAMYRAKSTRGSSIAYFYSEMQAEFMRRYQIEKILDESINKNLLYLNYQPIFNPQTGKIDGLEILLRLKNESAAGTEFYPDEFIPIAEQSGKIVEIGEWVIEKSLEQLKKWNDSYSNELKISINLSGIQLETDNLIDIIKSNITKNKIKPELIEFEITETAFLSPNEEIKNRISTIRDMGCHIALDDFGTGYSSISHLLHFPISTVKFDKSIMPSGPDDKNSIKLIEALTAMANTLEIDIVAEGIETEFQLSVIKSNHIKRAQGYLFRKPTDGKSIEDEYFS